LLAFPAVAIARAGDGRVDLTVEGFTDPYRTVEVAAADTGTIDQVLVVEGDVVVAGQLVAALDQELHRSQLAIAREWASAKGKLDSVQAELSLRKDRLAKLEMLSAQGFARPEEVERARADVKLGEADLLSALEEQRVRKRELEHAEVQLERRNIRARLNGVVTKVHKEVGEFVAANDPAVITVVQLNPLRLVLSIPRNHALRMKDVSTVPIRFVATQIEVSARVEHVSPVTDAESNTVMVRLTIDNSDGRFRAGDRCLLDLSRLPERTESKVALPVRPADGTRSVPAALADGARDAPGGTLP
jgi:RND family efflux transporter MFP subunit